MSAKIIAEVKSWAGDWRVYLAEFLTTFAFVFICQSVIISDQLYNHVGVLGISLAIGFSYTALVFASSHLSGGYLNPAVVVALWLAAKISHLKALSLVVAQIVAGFAAAGVVILVFGSKVYDKILGGGTLGVGVDLANATGLEAILTAILVLIVFATVVDRTGPVSFAPLALGVYLVAATILAFPITGAVFNPARAVGSAVLASSYDTLAVWIIGPVSGSLFAIVYELAFLERRRK